MKDPPTGQPPRIETPTPENYLCKCLDCNEGFYNLLDWYEHRIKQHDYADLSKLQEYRQT